MKLAALEAGDDADADTNGDGALGPSATPPKKTGVPAPALPKRRSWTDLALGGGFLGRVASWPSLSPSPSPADTAQKPSGGDFISFSVIF